MRIAVLSDIHGNLEAYLEVAEDIARRSPDKVIVLGDLVGYGPDPEDVVQLTRQNGYLALQGNHEAAIFEPKMRGWLNFQARENSLKTEQLLSDESLEYCAALPQSVTVEQALFIHGFPPDSIQQYLNRVAEKRLINYFAKSEGRLAFVGHTHDLVIVSWDGRHLRRKKLEEKRLRLSDKDKYIINVGSVGQPRDGNNLAKYVLWDTTNNTLDMVAIPYDYETTMKKIRRRGFPEAYGLRLS